MERQRNSWGRGFNPAPTSWISQKCCALHSNCGGFAKAGVRSRLQAVPRKKKGLKKKNKETVDTLRHSGVGAELDEDVDGLDLIVSFKWFAEIHGVMVRRSVVSPPSLINLSNFSSQRSGTSGTINKDGQSTQGQGPDGHIPCSTGRKQVRTHRIVEAENGMG